jgi:uncharacterized membrane-anchored protein YitT (DUF2179 family)
VQNWLLLTAGALALAVNINLFLVPAKIAPGGVSGVAIIVNNFTGWPIGLTMLVLNIPLIGFGYYYLGRFRFLASSLYAVLIYSLGTDLLAHWLPTVGITDDLLLNALYGGIVGGLGAGLVFRGGGSTAGTGILGRVLQMKTGIPVSQIYLLTDGGIILVAGLAFGWEMALYALITVFVWGLATDFVLEGPSVVRTAFIVTDRPQQVAEKVLQELNLGMTAWPAQGMFTETEHTVLFCTVSRPHERTFRRAVIQADPTAFLVIGHGHQAHGGMFGQARHGR